MSMNNEPYLSSNVPNTNIPNPYIFIQNKEVSNNYEIILPIAFTILFLIFLFIVYLINTYCLSGDKKNSADCLCCLYKSEHELPRSVIYSNNTGFNMQNRNDNCRRSTTSCNSYNYCEESRAGFYHVQKPNNFVGKTYTFNHNYDKICDSHPSNLILAYQQRNLINQSGNNFSNPLFYDKQLKTKRL